MCNCTFNGKFFIKPVHTDAQNMWIARDPNNHHSITNLNLYYNPYLHGHENLVTISKIICDF